MLARDVYTEAGERYGEKRKRYVNDLEGFFFSV